ncbi:MAG: DUF4252 domain-containing protein [Bacteroidota bacterium]
MKRSIFLFVALMATAGLFAQNSVIDKVFAKYSGKEGITTVSISPELFKLAAAMDEESMKDEDFPVEKVSALKVLAVEDPGAVQGVDFFTEVLKDLNMADYKEVMTVQDGSDNVKMLMKTDGTKIFEFIILTGGEESALVYISGDFTMADLENVSHSAGNFGVH